MEFRRNEGRNRWTVADADTGNVATENAVLPVIDMNVTEEDMANIFGCEVSLPKIGNYIVESRFRAGIEKRDAVVGLDRSRSNNAGPSELTRVENVQHTENTRERGPRG